MILKSEITTFSENEFNTLYADPATQNIFNTRLPRYFQYWLRQDNFLKTKAKLLNFGSQWEITTKPCAQYRNKCVMPIIKMSCSEGETIPENRFVYLYARWWFILPKDIDGIYYAIPQNNYCNRIPTNVSFFTYHTPLYKGEEKNVMFENTDAYQVLKDFWNDLQENADK